VRVDDDREVEATRFETEYRRAVVRNLDKMELFGVDLSRASRVHPLSIAYVSLDVGGPVKTITPTEVDVDVAEIDESTVHGVETALADSERLLIRGPAGAGKTTLLRWIAVRAASRSFEYPLEHWNGLVPFLIRLRQSVDANRPRPEHFPSLVAPSISDTMPHGWVHRILTEGSAVVLVDGADEVPENKRKDIRTWLKEIVETFPKCRFVMTSRPHAVEAHWLDDEDFLDTDLQPMDTAGIETFIDHWHRAVGQEVQREEEIASLGRLAKSLKSTLRGNLGIRRLATSPLLCSVICALNRDTNEQIPGDRLDLYERCCSMLLERRDPESGLTFKDYPKLSYRQKRSLLDDLAYWMIKNDWSEISLDLAKGRLDKKCEAFRRDERDSAAITGDSSLHFFLERSGILREPLKGKVDFAHRTFQGFMAANAATVEGDVGVLLSNATKSQWREVIALGAGLARPNERADLIKSLLCPVSVRASDNGHRDQLLSEESLCLR
jgi:predicted NACHT family NTPase